MERFARWVWAVGLGGPPGLAGVQPCGAAYFGVSAGPADLPARGVDGVVMAKTEQCFVGYFGFSALGSGNDVVKFCARGRNRAPRNDAATIAGSDGVAHRGRKGALFVTDAQHLVVRSTQHRDESATAECLINSLQ